MTNTIANGHKKLEHTIEALSEAAKKKSAEIKRNVMNQYSDAKDSWEELDGKLHKNPWVAVASVAAVGALIGFCAGLLKKK